VFAYNTGKDEDENRIIFFNPYIPIDLFIGNKNLFNDVLTWVEIEKKTGDITMWGTFLRKRAPEPKTESKEEMETYLADQTLYGDQDYILGPPTYILKNAVLKNGD